MDLVDHGQYRRIFGIGTVADELPHAGHTAPLGLRQSHACTNVAASSCAVTGTTFTRLSGRIQVYQWVTTIVAGGTLLRDHDVLVHQGPSLP